MKTLYRVGFATGLPKIILAEKSTRWTEVFEIVREALPGKEFISVDGILHAIDYNT